MQALHNLVKADGLDRNMPPRFGTSGLRGLAAELTEPLIQSYTWAFLDVCSVSGALHVGHDLRESSPRIVRSVIDAATAAGLDVFDHGALPTPALALSAMAAREAAIMVTGSHIPANRNGLKFYTANGEIGKSDEAAILGRLGAASVKLAVRGTVHQNSVATKTYCSRYSRAFGHMALSGLRVGVYQHSSVARDILAEVLSSLGATVVLLARSESFIPVDTEAVDADTRRKLEGWCQAHRLDALVSTDGDGDRPMVADSHGQIVPGDVLGPLTARRLGAEVICTPVSSNTLVEAMGAFAEVRRTRIGSPHVIAEMQSCGDVRVAGYEANGGFLLGFETVGLAKPIAPLLTRDCILPIVTPLAAMREIGTNLAELVRALPSRFTATDRLKDVPSERSADLLQKLIKDPSLRREVLASDAVEFGVDLTDGLRVTYVDETIIHLRPSGNAPEFRCYTESDSSAQAEASLRRTLDALKKILFSDSLGSHRSM